MGRYSMRIALFSDIYKPHINGVVNHVGLLKEHFDRWGEQVYLFVPEQDKKTVDEGQCHSPFPAFLSPIPAIT